MKGIAIYLVLLFIVSVIGKTDTRTSGIRPNTSFIHSELCSEPEIAYRNPSCD